MLLYEISSTISIQYSVYIDKIINLLISLIIINWIEYIEHMKYAYALNQCRRNVLCQFSITRISSFLYLIMHSSRKRLSAFHNCACNDGERRHVWQYA